MRENKIKKDPNKIFGMVFFIFFLIIAFYPLINNEGIRFWSLIISLIFLILGLLKPRVLAPLNLAWIKFGILLGKFISPIVMAIVFFLVITPIGLLMRFAGKDLLNLKPNKHKSYWIEKKDSKSEMKDQF